MTIRECQQLAALAVSILTVIFSLVSIRTRPDKIRSHLFFGVYGLIGVVYYIIVFFVGAPLSHELSPIRTLTKDTLIATWVGLWVFCDLMRIRIARRL